MPESIVQVNEGTGKKLHTWQRTVGANIVENEVVILGDQYQASYVIDIGTAASVATANDHILQIMAGATLNTYIRRISIWQVALATAAAYGTVQILRLTTAGTGGTAVAADKVDETDAVAGTTGIVIPGVKGTEGTRLYSWTNTYTQTISATPGKDALLFDREWGMRIKPLRIPAGVANGICIKHVTAIAAASVWIVVELTEANY